MSSRKLNLQVRSDLELEKDSLEREVRVRDRARVERRTPK